MMRCVKCRGRQHLRQKILSGTWQIAVQPLREVRAFASVAKGRPPKTSKLDGRCKHVLQLDSVRIKEKDRVVSRFVFWIYARRVQYLRANIKQHTTKLVDSLTAWRG